MNADIEDSGFMYHSASQACYSFIHTKSGNASKLNTTGLCGSGGVFVLVSDRCATSRSVTRTLATKKLSQSQLDCLCQQK